MHKEVDIEALRATPFRRLLCTVSVLFCFVFVGTACTQLGPRVAEVGRTDYNLALQRADDRQLLLNIVRLRYRDRPYFLEVSGVATQFTMNASVGALAALGSPRIEQDVLLSSSVGLEEHPTVTFTPLQSSEFARHIMTPISIDALASGDTLFCLTGCASSSRRHHSESGDDYDRRRWRRLRLGCCDRQGT
ncbi:MAG: hypothetical protein ACU84Q_21815 [Gammaproteobacteria bacterium]